MAIEGVDYSYARPKPSALAAAGKKFAVRYAGPGSDGKHLHAAELAALRAAGLDVVANAEGAAGGYTGTAAGRFWAASAQADFRALGMPADRPIYFSVDFDAGPKDWPAIDAALRGSASVLGADRVGVYGSYDVVKHCHDAGTAKWLWQTYAWSGGRQYAQANLYQYKNGVTIGGGDCDLTRALTADYGQWGFSGDDMPLTNADKPIIKQALADAFADAATTTDDTAANDVAWGRGFRKSLDAVFDFAATAGPLADSVKALTVMVAAQNSVSAADLAAALAPMLQGQIGEGATPTQVEDILRRVFGSLDAKP